MRIRDISITRKLGGAFLAVILVFFGVSAILMWSLASLETASEDVQVGASVQKNAADMMANVIEQENAIRAFSTFADPSFLTVFEAKKKAAEDAAASFQAQSRVDSQKVLVTDFMAQIGTWQSGIIARIVKLAGDPATRVEAQRLAGQKSLEAVRVVMRKIEQGQTDRLAALSARQKSATMLARMTLILGGIIAAICAGGLGLLLSRAIANPVVTMTDVMGRLADGDNGVTVPETVRKDEIGAMARAVLVFQQAAIAKAQADVEQREIVDQIAAGLGRLSDGDLTVALSGFPATYAALERDFNNAVAALTATLTAVNQSTSGIRTGSNEISVASDDLSRRTEQQAASLEETAAAMDEITATVRETASGALRANEVVHATRSDAEDGGRVVRKAVDAMGGIERASNEISEIISVIDGIAFQTNLLALNAGVEAARAGDAGRGFAVVASEVRALAQRSADAAKDVKTKITASAGQVEIGVDLVAETGRALERIVTRIAEVSQLVSDIATSAEQQASGLQQVNTAVGEMDSVTQQNAAMVEESNAAARSLAAEAEDLARHVARFRLGERAGAAAKPRTSVVPMPSRIVATRRGGGVSGALALAEQPAADDWSKF